MRGLRGGWSRAVGTAKHWATWERGHPGAGFAATGAPCGRLRNCGLCPNLKAVFMAAKQSP
jgi:hypothetical protein